MEGRRRTRLTLVLVLVPELVLLVPNLIFGR